jgi:hypothetical protein
MMTDRMATESTEKHGKTCKEILIGIGCFRVFPWIPWLMTKKTGSQPDLSASIIIKLKA